MKLQRNYHQGLGAIDVKHCFSEDDGLEVQLTKKPYQKKGKIGTSSILKIQESGVLCADHSRLEKESHTFICAGEASQEGEAKHHEAKSC